jgi:hypothetical protein
VHQEMPEPTEEEIRAALEEQIRHLRVEDVVLQTIATLINIAVLRLGLAGQEDEKDVEQAKMAIDAARALVPVTPPDQGEAVKEALSQVQMAFAREAQTQVQTPAAGPDTPPSAAQPDEEAEREKPRSKIWTPPGT